MSSKLFFATTLLSLFSSVYSKSNAQSQEWIWAQGLGGEDDCTGYSVVIDPHGSGDVYIMGEFIGTVDFDPGPGTFNLTAPGPEAIFISKLDPMGHFIWAKAIGAISRGYGRPIAIDPSGNGDIYITGYFEETVDFDPGEQTNNITSTGGSDIFILKLNSDGQFIWATNIGSPEDDEGYALQADPSGNGNIYLTGSFESTIIVDQGIDTFIINSKGHTDILILKLNSSGQLIWSKSLGGTDYDEVYTLALDPAGNGDVFTTGYFGDTADFDPDSSVEFNLTAQLYGDVFISKLDSNGAFVWAKAITGFYGLGTSIAIDPGGSGDVYTVGGFGGTMDFDPGADTFNMEGTAIFISKLDRWGNFVWAKAIPIQDGDIALSIALDPSGNGSIYTTGLFNGTSDFDPGEEIFNLTAVANQDIFVSKLDYAGDFVWAKSIGGGETDAGYTIAIDTAGSNELFLTGGFYSSNISFDSIKLTNTGLFSLDLFIAKLGDFSTSLINTSSNTPQISIYPNPANDKLTIVLDKDILSDLNISVYTILGEIVSSNAIQHHSNEVTIDLSALVSGIYFIEIEMNGQRVVKKVVKE